MKSSLFAGTENGCEKVVKALKIGVQGFTVMVYEGGSVGLWSC